MSHYLNYPLARPRQPVAHDIAPLCRSVEGFIKAYKEEGMWGSVEIGGVMAWQIIRQELPDLKTVVVRRPLQEVYQSVAALGYQAHLSNLAEFNALLDIVAQQPGVFSITSDSLDVPAAGKWLFEYCLELEFDFDWWSQMAALNIQVNIDDVMRIMPEIDERYQAFQQDVLSRMKEVQSRLN